jgi:hypothetical protein
VGIFNALGQKGILCTLSYVSFYVVVLRFDFSY